MTISTPSQKTSSDRLALILSAWGLILLISNLPDVLWTAVTGEIPGWLFWAKVGILGVALALCWLWKRLRPLWQFALVMLVFFLALEVTARIRNGEWWQTTFNGENVSFGLGFLGIFLLDTAVALKALLTLWLIHRKMSAFFFVKGHTRRAHRTCPLAGNRQGWFVEIFRLVLRCCCGGGRRDSHHPVIAANWRSPPASRIAPASCNSVRGRQRVQRRGLFPPFLSLHADRYCRKKSHLTNITAQSRERAG